MITHRLSVRFRDIDALNHVNNSVYLTYLEEARFTFLSHYAIDIFANPDCGVILAKCEINFRHPAKLGDTLDIEVEVGEIRRSSFDFMYNITRVYDRKLIADATTTQVCYNYSLNTPVRVPEHWRVTFNKNQPKI